MSDLEKRVADLEQMVRKLQWALTQTGTYDFGVYSLELNREQQEEEIARQNAGFYVLR